jgi:hypothetical protein
VHDSVGINISTKKSPRVIEGFSDYLAAGTGQDVNGLEEVFLGEFDGSATPVGEHFPGGFHAITDGFGHPFHWSDSSGIQHASDLIFLSLADKLSHLLIVD